MGIDRRMILQMLNPVARDRNFREELGRRIEVGNTPRARWLSTVLGSHRSTPQPILEGNLDWLQRAFGDASPLPLD